MKSRNDSKGYERGALGIDGKKGENYVSGFRDQSNEKAMYGRSWWNIDGVADVNGKNEKRPLKESPDYDTK